MACEREGHLWVWEEGGGVFSGVSADVMGCYVDRSTRKSIRHRDVRAFRPWGVVSSTDMGSPHQITKSTVHAGQVRVGHGPGQRTCMRGAGTRQMEPGCGLGAG